MYQYLRDHGRPFTVEKLKQIGEQILSGLKYLHMKKIIHQDIKPNNIMFNADYSYIKLIDLGVSSKLDKTKATKAAQGGTPRYMPPE